MSLPKLPDIDDVPFYDTTDAVPQQMLIDVMLYSSIKESRTVNELVDRVCDHYYIYRNRSRFCTWSSSLRDAICRDAWFFDEPEYEYGALLGTDMRCRRPLYHFLMRTVTKMLEDIPEASDGYEVEDPDELLKAICVQCREIWKHNQKLNFKAKLTGGDQVDL